MNFLRTIAFILEKLGIYYMIFASIMIIFGVTTITAVTMAGAVFIFTIGVILGDPK